MAQQKKDNKKQGNEESFGVTEFNVDEFNEAEAEKYNQKYPEIEIPAEVEDDIDNDYDIKEHDSDEEGDD